MTGRNDWRWDDAQELPEGDEIAARLALSADPVEPDPALRERVMASIDAVEHRRRGAAQQRRLVIAVAAASALLAAGLTYGLVGGAPVDAGPDPALADAIAAAEAAEARAEELEEMLDEQDGELAELERALRDASDALAVLVAERVERLDLAAVEASVDAKARVYWDWDDYSCYFVAEGLPAARSGAYVLWLTTDEGELLRAGSFDAASGRRATFYAKLPKDMGHVVRAAVTQEADPEGEAPEGDVLLSGGV